MGLKSFFLGSLALVHGLSQNFQESEEINDANQRENRLFWTSDDMNTGFLGDQKWTRVFWTDGNGNDFSGWTKMDENFMNGQKWSRVFWTDKNGREYSGWSKIDSSFIVPEKFRSDFPWRREKDIPFSSFEEKFQNSETEDTASASKENIGQNEKPKIFPDDDSSFEKADFDINQQNIDENPRIWLRVVLEDENGQKYFARVRADKEVVKVERDFEGQKQSKDKNFMKNPEFQKSNIRNFDQNEGHFDQRKFQSFKDSLGDSNQYDINNGNHPEFKSLDNQEYSENLEQFNNKRRQQDFDHIRSGNQNRQFPNSRYNEEWERKNNDFPQKFEENFDRFSNRRQPLSYGSNDYLESKRFAEIKYHDRPSKAFYRSQHYKNQENGQNSEEHGRRQFGRDEDFQRNFDYENRRPVINDRQYENPRQSMNHLDRNGRSNYNEFKNDDNRVRFAAPDYQNLKNGRSYNGNFKPEKDWSLKSDFENEQRIYSNRDKSFETDKYPYATENNSGNQNERRRKPVYFSQGKMNSNFENQFERFADSRDEDERFNFAKDSQFSFEADRDFDSSNRGRNSAHYSRQYFEEPSKYFDGRNNFESDHHRRSNFPDRFENDFIYRQFDENDQSDKNSQDRSDFYRNNNDKQKNFHRFYTPDYYTGRYPDQNSRFQGKDFSRKSDQKKQDYNKSKNSTESGRPKSFIPRQDNEQLTEGDMYDVWYHPNSSDFHIRGQFKSKPSFFSDEIESDNGRWVHLRC